MPPTSPTWNRRLADAQDEVRQTLQDLPGPVHARARHLPVCYESRPAPALVRDGVEPDLLGLFVGDAFPDALAGCDPLPPQILLFLDNLWDYAQEDPETYRAEVRRTYLHELGHYLGLDEDELADRDLD